MVTAAAESTDLSALSGLSVSRQDSLESTAFHNHYDQRGRVQTLLSRAAELRLIDVPAKWRRSEIVHLAPIAREIDLELCTGFPGSFVGLSAQGLLRNWDSEGRVVGVPWEDCLDCLRAADTVIVSIEDLQLDWQSAERLAPHCRLLVVTEGERGARYCVNGKWQRVAGIPTQEIDPTGAGDIFAALFFLVYVRAGDPAVAADAANRVAAASVSRPGLAAVPSAAEVRAALQPVGM